MGFKDKDGKYRPTENNDKKGKVNSKDAKDSKDLPPEKRDTGVLKDKKIVTANAKEHDVSVSVIDELRTLEDDKEVLIEDVDDGGNTVGNYGKYLTLTNGATYNLFKDYHEMEKEAKERIEQDLDEGLFNADFLESHQTISETDARMFGIDAGDMAVDGRDLDELKEMADHHGVDYEDPDDIEEPEEDDFKTPSSYEKAYDAWETKVDDAKEKLESKLIDDVSSEVADDVEKRINDNGLRNYIVDDEGFCSDEEFQ